MTEMDKYLYMRNMMFTALKTIQFENMDEKKVYHIGLEIYYEELKSKLQCIILKSNRTHFLTYNFHFHPK